MRDTTANALFLHCHSPLVTHGLMQYMAVLRVTSWRQVPLTACAILLVDQPLRHELLMGSAWLHYQRPHCQVLYLIGQISPLRVHVAERCQPIGLIDINHEILTGLPQRVTQVLAGQCYISPTIARLQAQQATLLRRLADLSWTSLLVLVQLVEGASPKIIARRLGVSVGSIYQQQARLRAYFNVPNNADLRALLRPPDEVPMEGV